MPRDNFSPDMRDRLEPDREGFYPDADRTTIFRGADVVLANLGQAFCYLSIHVVRRGSLMAAMRSGLDVALSPPDLAADLPAGCRGRPRSSLALVSHTAREGALTPVVPG